MDWQYNHHKKNGISKTKHYSFSFYNIKIHLKLDFEKYF